MLFPRSISQWNPSRKGTGIWHYKVQTPLRLGDNVVVMDDSRPMCACANFLATLGGRWAGLSLFFAPLADYGQDLSPRINRLASWRNCEKWREMRACKEKWWAWLVRTWSNQFHKLTHPTTNGTCRKIRMSWHWGKHCLKWGSGAWKGEHTFIRRWQTVALKWSQCRHLGAKRQIRPGSTYQSSGSQSRNPLANGLLAIFSWVICNIKNKGSLSDVIHSIKDRLAWCKSVLLCRLTRGKTRNSR